jgi:hypothetical protein
MNNVDIDNQKSRKSSHMKNHHSTEEEVQIPLSASAPVPLGEMTTVLKIQRVPQRRLPSSFREHEQKVPSSESALISSRQPRVTRGRIIQHSEAVINECRKNPGPEFQQLNMSSNNQLVSSTQLDRFAIPVFLYQH